MESNKFISVVLVVIGLLLAGILVVLLLGNKSKPNQYEGAFDNVPTATLNNQQVPNQVQGTNTQTPVQPAQTQPTPAAAVTLDMSSSYAQTYKSLFTAELAKPANFNGHYRVVEVGCGSGCTQFYAIDKTTGKVLKVPTQYMDADEGGPKEVTNFYYSADSGVLVISTTTFQYRYQIVNGQFQLVSTQ